YRFAVPVGKYNAAGWGLTTLLIVYGYYLIGSHTHPAFLKHLPKNAHAKWLLEPSEHTSIAIYSLLIAWLILSLLYIFRPKPLSINGAAPEEQAKLDAFLKHEQGNLLTHMLFTGDKSFFWAMDNRILIPY